MTKILLNKGISTILYGINAENITIAQPKLLKKYHIYLTKTIQYLPKASMTLPSSF